MNTKSDAEIVATILNISIDRSREILGHLGGLRGLFSVEQRVLFKMGITKKQAEKIHAVWEIGKRYLKEELMGKCYLNEPKSVVDYLYSSMRDLKIKIFKVIFLDRANRLMGEEDISIGTVDEAAVHPRTVMEAVLNHKASGVILVHNHPSGMNYPSQEDQQLTRKLQTALAVIGVRVLDHLIIGDNNYFSFKEHNLLN